MSTITAMTGLNAAQADLAATSNNIANVGTIGFHKSRAEFGDMYANSPHSPTKTQVGTGTNLIQMRQSFEQGAIESSGNILDMAIAGAGFFAMRTELDSGVAIYSRAGAFGMDKDGYVADSAGNYLLAYPVAEDGSVLNQSLDQAMPLNIPLTAGVPSPTTEVDLSLNFSSLENGEGTQDAVPPSLPFDPEDNTTYANVTPISIFDKNGEPQDAKLFLVKSKEPDPLDQTTVYELQVTVGLEVLDQDDPTRNSITFDEFGFMVDGYWPIGFSGMNDSVGIDLTGSALTRENFAVKQQNHNGEAHRSLTGVQVDQGGTIWASYSGEEAIALGMAALANFNNPQGLRQVGNANYIASPESGDVIAGRADSGGFGELRWGALENSNVDLTAELVKLITAQRNYQANAKSLETSQSLTKTILNMRS